MRSSTEKNVTLKLAEYATIYAKRDSRQIPDLILSDNSLLKSIVEAVSSAIIENMFENKSFISKVADRIAQNEQTKDKIKQDLYKSLSFHQEQLQNKYTALQNSYEQIKKSCNNIVQCAGAIWKKKLLNLL